MPFTASIPATSIDLLADIRDTFGPRGGVTPNNLHGFTGRDIGIPNAPPLKFSDFTGKGVHTGRKDSMLGYLSYAGYNPYQVNSGYVYPNGLIGYTGKITHQGGGGIPYATLYLAVGGKSSSCSLAYSLSHPTPGIWYETQIAAIAGERTVKPRHCTQNTGIVVACSDDGGISTAIDELGITGSGAPTLVVNSSSTNNTNANLKLAYAPSNIKAKDISRFVTSGNIGGCNGGKVILSTILPNKWTAAPIGPSSWNAISVASNPAGGIPITFNWILQPWEACIVCRRGTGDYGDAIYCCESNLRVLNSAGTAITGYIGMIIGTGDNWYGRASVAMFVNMSDSPIRVSPAGAERLSWSAGTGYGAGSLTGANTTYEGISCCDANSGSAGVFAWKISFVGDDYTYVTT